MAATVVSNLVFSLDDGGGMGRVASTGDGMELCCRRFTKDDIMAATVVSNRVFSLDDGGGMGRVALTGDGMELCCGIFTKDDVILAAALVCNREVSSTSSGGVVCVYKKMY